MERRPVPHLSGRKLLAHGTAYLANCTVITGASLVSGVTRQDTTLRPASDFSPASLLCMSTLASVRIVNVHSAVPFGPPSDPMPGIGDSRAAPNKPGAFTRATPTSRNSIELQGTATSEIGRDTCREGVRPWR